MNNFCQLPFQFDVDLLHNEFTHIQENLWIDHFVKSNYEGSWCAVSLRSVGGEQNHIYSDPASKKPFQDTPILQQCPYFQEVINTLECEKTSVRLLRLTSGSIIKKHRDYNLSIEDREIRIHVPIYTHPDVEFFLCDRRVVMNEGECWFLDLSLPHRLNNKSPIDRIHMVLDCVVNDWFLDVLQAQGIETQKIKPDIDPSITKENIDVIIETLKNMGTDASLQQATKLEEHRKTLFQ
jgi:hypothetical protein